MHLIIQITIGIVLAVIVLRMLPFIFRALPNILLVTIWGMFFWYDWQKAIKFTGLLAVSAVLIVGFTVLLLALPARATRIISLVFRFFILITLLVFAISMTVLESWWIWRIMGNQWTKDDVFSAAAISLVFFTSWFMLFVFVKKTRNRVMDSPADCIKDVSANGEYEEIIEQNDFSRNYAPISRS